MKMFTNLPELLKRLNTERRLLHALFQARMKFDFTYEEALKLVDNERNLHLLIDYGIVRQDGELLELDETYQHFFEEVLQLNENITSSSVEDNLQQLNNNIDFYLKERTNPDSQRKYVNKIIRTLRNISVQTANKTVDLKRVINDTYRQERNYEIKRLKFQDYISTIDNIAYLIRNTEQVLDERKDVLEVMTSDNRINRVAIEVRIRFKEVFHSLIELENTIRDYIHQIEIYNLKVKRIRKLKYLKDQLTWEKTTSVCRMLKEHRPLLLETLPVYYTKISIPLLRNTDIGLDILSTASKYISTGKKRKIIQQMSLNPEDLDSGFIVEDFVDTDKIAEAFFASSQDLFSFVMTYHYVTPKEKEQKVEYYTEILLNHHPKLLITDKWATDGMIEYPLIYNKP